MLLKEIHVTLEDVQKAGYEAVIRACDKPTCERYNEALISASRASEPPAKAVLALLAHVTSLHLKLDDQSEPFGPMVSGNFGRTAVLDDFTPEQMEVLANVAPSIVDAELRARVCDVLWVQKRDFQKAQVAVDAYLDSASTLEDPVKWVRCAERIERALQISMQLGRNSEQYVKVVAHIEALLDKYDGTDPLFLSARLMRLLHEQRAGDLVKYAQLAQKMAKAAEAQGDWRRAREYYQLEANWHGRNGDDAAVKSARLCYAATYEREARLVLADESPDYINGTTLFQQAIEAYRNVEGTSERVMRLHTELLAYQERVHEQLEQVEVGVDIREEVQESVNRVKGKEWFDALQALALRFIPTSVASLRKTIEEEIQNYPMAYIFSEQVIDSAGRVTTQRPGMLSSDPDEREQAVQAAMFTRAATYQSYTAQAYIEPARGQINLEHRIRDWDFVQILRNHPLIPPNRVILVARGLHAGLTGDLMVAAHLLVPQLENCIRYVLNRAGRITSSLSSEGIQEEYYLNRLLLMPETVQIFGEDVTFDLRCLLTERHGKNIRNLLSHGLIRQEDFMSLHMSYLWWLTLHLCWVPLITRQRSAAEVPAASEADPGPEDSAGSDGSEKLPN